MALRTQWRQVERFADAAAMHRRTAEALLAGCGTETESELAYMAAYHLGYSVECLLKARFLSAIRPKRHKRALEILKKSAGHDYSEMLALLGRLRKPVFPPPQMLRSLRKMRASWNVAMRYKAESMPVVDAAMFLAEAWEIEQWCAS